MVFNLAAFIAGGGLVYLLTKDGARPADIDIDWPTEPLPVTFDVNALAEAFRKALTGVPGETPPIGEIPSMGRGLVTPAYTKLFDNTALPDASTTYYPSGLVSCKDAERVIIVCRSTCDQALTIQTIGCETQQADANNSFDMEASQTLSATSSIALLLAREVWMPYIGVSVTTGSTAPTAGSLNAWVIVQKWS